MHFSRDRRSEAGAWLPVIDCWNVGRDKRLPPVSSNEPIGPGASVASEDDPERILAAAAFAYLAGLPMYVFHSASGVRAEQPFESMPWLRHFKTLLAILPRDLPNWEGFDANSDGNPFAAAPSNCHPLYRCGARKDKEFVLVPLALSEAGRSFTAKHDMTCSVHTFPDGGLVQCASVKRGEEFPLKVQAKACVLRGVIAP